MNRTRQLTACAVALFSLLTAQKAQPQLAETPWPVFRHDLRHTGRTPYAGPAEGNLAWIFESNSAILSSPAIDADGTIYFLSGNNLNALNPDGTGKWRITLPAGSAAGVELQSSPAIGNGGRIYVMTFDYLHSVNPDGSLHWSFLTKEGTRTHRNASSPVISGDGTIYFATYEELEGQLYAVNPDGSLKWKYRIGTSNCSPAISRDGSIIARSGSNLYSINPDGSLKWELTLKAGGISSPAIDENGVIYVGGGHNSAGFLVAVNPDGTEKWAFTTLGNRRVVASPAIGTDGTIYFGAHDNKFYALNPHGSLKWSFDTASLISSSAVVDAEGTLYFGSWDNKLYALNPDGTEKWTYETGGDVISSPSIDENGTLYVGSNDNKLYALVRTSKGENPDLTIAAIDFEPPIGTIAGKNVNVIPAVNELTGSQAATAEVFLYLNNKSNLLGSKSVQVFAGRSAHPKFSWNTQGLAPGRYDFIAVVRNSNPSESDTSNNELMQNYQVIASLQSRIDAAQAGDTVWVELGTYQENIKLKNAVVVKSLNGPKETVIDGGGDGVTVDASALSRSAVLEGFTITNGKGSILTGGGVDLDLSAATVRNNVISGNEPFGIHHRGFQSAWVEGNLIIDHTESFGWGVSANNSRAIFINNTFVGNNEGIHAIGFYVPSPTIVNCIFWNNGDDLTYTAVATYSNIEDGDSGFGNISLDPFFVDRINDDYRLQLNSPCIDAGDPTKLDRDGTRSDMGAYAVFQGGRFGTPVDLRAEIVHLNGGSQISLTWDSPPPILDVSVERLDFDIYDLGWAFFLQNTGLGRLNWTAMSDQPWLGLLPDSGVAILGRGQLIALVSRKNLPAGEYWGNIIIASNGGNKTIPVTLEVGNTPEPGKWQGSGISFAVSNNMKYVSNLVFTRSSGNQNFRFEFYGSVEIDSTQSFTIVSGDVTIAGHFDSRKTASGTYQIPFAPAPSGNWSATWSSSGVSKAAGTSTIAGELFSEIQLITGYNIYRRTSLAQYDSALASVPGNVFNFIDSSATIGESYYYVVDAFDQDGQLSDKSNEVGPMILTPSEVESQLRIPASFDLAQSYPNPFNPETTIKYQLPKSSEVALKIYNMFGQLVTTLVDEKQPAGYYTVRWNGRDEYGRPVASGVYLYRLTAGLPPGRAGGQGEFVQVRKMILVR